MKSLADCRIIGIWTLLLVVLTACSSPAATPPAAVSEETPAANAADTPETTAEEPEVAGDADYIFGMVMVGPYNDAGWSQAHYEGALYVEERLDHVRFVYVDKVNPADRPNITVQQVIDDLVEQGAEFIITNSDDFKDGTREAAQAHPDVTFLHISGDDVLTGKAPDNLGNLMGRMIYGKMIAGCAAALQTETGNIAYVGPLINDETRRLVNSAYLGARYCWDNLREEPPADDLTFSVTWIGFWFNIPGVTLDPTQVANDFINADNDVLISGIDTTEALVEANKSTEAGTPVFALPYDFAGACAQAEDVCLGVPYFNWGPAYMQEITAARTGTWEQQWQWLEPDWADINNLDTSAIGFAMGQALTPENQEQLQTFIDGLADGSINLFTGPLTYNDGSVFLEEGETLTPGTPEDDERIWYMQDCLESIQGQCATE
ncbi:MAG: BMP family ABC transporter substrate-binding protein [Chloroflexaceae bacterium]|nr:BMP family ABC transporter substrate-binding protein [Chloroflexaceae bacterium]